MTKATGNVDYEAIVIGSGFGGAVTACRLAGAGVRTCILERGQRFDAENDFPVHPVPESPNVPSDVPKDGLDAIQPDVSRLLWKLGDGVWDLRDLGGVLVGQAAGFGGGSLIYANAHLRPPEHIFDERWPIKREKLDPYYDLAAQVLEVSHLPEDPAEAGLPKRIQLQRAARHLRTREPYLRSFSPPLAVNFQRCDLAGNCCFGCPKKAKNTLDMNYLFEAESKGAGVITRAEVTSIERIKDHRFRVEYRDHSEGQKVKSLEAQNVFLCAGAVNTTELLLRCRDPIKLPLTSTALGTRFHPNQDAVATVFDCDEPQELDRGPTITSSLVYDREPGDQEPSARWRLSFAGASVEPVVGSEIFRTQDDQAVKHPQAKVVAPPYIVSGSYQEGNATGELTLGELDGFFDEGDELRTEAGPCGTVETRPHKLRHWLLIQDGGLPAALEPTLGVFRSPLWLHRNAFREQSRPRASREWPLQGMNGGVAHVAVSQRTGFAALPFEALTDLFSGLARNAAGPQLHEVSELGLQLLRAPYGGQDERRAERQAIDGPEDPRRWRLLPDQLRDALEEVRRQTLDDVGFAAEDLVGAFLDSAAKAAQPQLKKVVATLPEKFQTQIDTYEDMAYPVRLALRLGVQLVWGSQGGLATAIAEQVASKVLPGRERVAVTGVELLKRALDYRLGNGRTAVLLSMGLDSTPGRLELELPAAPQVGAVLRGATSGTQALILKSCPPVVVTAGETGAFQHGETLLVGQQRIGICDGHVLLSGDPRLESVTDLPIHALLLKPVQPRNGRSPASTARLRATMPPMIDTPERGIQERIFRDLASAWGGELRTDPLWTFLKRRATVHPQGGCPMGRSPERGVTDVKGQVYGCPGLYVMDAAAFPGPVGANPSATIAAVAEYKVYAFLRSRLGRADPRVKELEEKREKATTWVEEQGRAKLDPLGPCGEARPVACGTEPAHRPVGIQFQEKMVGAVEGDAGAHIETQLTVRIDDLADFLAHHARDSNVRVPIVKGTLRIAACERPVDPERSFMRVMADRGLDEAGREVRTIEYKLVSQDGRCWLQGEKTIRDDEGIDAWKDTTTLEFRLCETGVPSRGVLRLGASEFFSSQIPSFKVDTDDPARQAWAMASFGRFFFGNLVDVYFPALDTLGELGVGLLRRGHD